MSAFDDMLARDAAIFVDPDLTPGVEAIVYKDRDGSEKKFNVQVFRAQMQKTEGNEALQFVPLSVFIANSATAGRTTVPDSGDEIKVSTHAGQCATWHAVARIVNSDAGGWTVELS